MSHQWRRVGRHGVAPSPRVLFDVKSGWGEAWAWTCDSLAGPLFVVSCEARVSARTARGFACLSVERGAGLVVFWVSFNCTGLGGVSMPSFLGFNRQCLCGVGWFLVRWGA